MKRLVIASLLATGVLGAQAQTPYPYPYQNQTLYQNPNQIQSQTPNQVVTFTDNARVRGVEPQYENVSVPRNECRSQWINEDRRGVGDRQGRNYGGAILGGLAGGVLGNQVGGGRGKQAATVVGAVVGAMTGDHFANRDQRVDNDYGQREVQNCRTVYDTQSRLTGYRVAYEYRGQQYNTFMRNHPGNNLQVRVSLDPIER